MRPLLDASALLNIVKRAELDKLRDVATLDLVLYEALNAIWKEHVLLERMDWNTAYEFSKLVSEVFNVIEKHGIEGLELDILQQAVEHGITIYDASYLTIAVKKNFILVTDDERLSEKIKNKIMVKNSRSI
ncbi:type II toxin-antitoxin system VapC family toxin [Candidatus Bathyarchaeota archaeon]|nr:type II toxin-antitoxin system VapC family toxin [Candidatus Bathyarchaeota archaeon]